MSFDPILQQFLPEKNPYLDMRDYLVNGWQATGEGSFAIRPDGNGLDLVMRVRGENASSRVIADLLPFKPPYFIRFQAFYGTELVTGMFNGTGRIFLDIFPPFTEEVALMLSVPRSPEI